jgi:hypothetical protein
VRRPLLLYPYMNHIYNGISKLHSFLLCNLNLQSELCNLKSQREPSNLKSAIYNLKSQISTQVSDLLRHPVRIRNDGRPVECAQLPLLHQHPAIDNRRPHIVSARDVDEV